MPPSRSAILIELLSRGNMASSPTPRGAPSPTKSPVRLGVSIEEAALSILDLTTESMVNAIEDIYVKQGIDPADTVIIGGGAPPASMPSRLPVGCVAEPSYSPASARCSARPAAVLSEMSTEFSALLS